MCKSCRSRQELSNKHLVAKFGVDTAEPASQPRTGLSKFAKNLPKVRKKHRCIGRTRTLRVGPAPDAARWSSSSPWLSSAARRSAPARSRVERFDRRGTEPFEPFEFFLENSKISENFNIFQIIGEIPTKVHQNLSKNQSKELKKRIFANFARNEKNFDEKFLKY